MQITQYSFVACLTLLHLCGYEFEGKSFTGVYGNVHRVKILFNKKDNALVQMADPSQAQQGKRTLSHLTIVFALDQHLAFISTIHGAKNPQKTQQYP